VGAGAVAVVCISPARVTPDSAHVRTIANAKRLILSFSPLRFRNASRLARKHDSVNTYSAIDTASRAVSNIGAGKKDFLTLTNKGFIFREDGLT